MRLRVEAEAVALVLDGLTNAHLTGQVAYATSIAVSVRGLSQVLVVGDTLTLERRDTERIQGAVVGFAADASQIMGFGYFDGIGPGSPAMLAGRVNLERTLTLTPTRAEAKIDSNWLGCVVDALGSPISGAHTSRSPLMLAGGRRHQHDSSIRARLGMPISLGVRAIDVFTTCRRGQRLGLFAGSGVGKSSLLAMLARNTTCEVVVIAMIGERGREVREFVEETLGSDALARSVVVAATSDQTPVARRQAAYSAMGIAEHFRDQGCEVLLLMDSVTRFCHALRDIALATGELPVSRGYPPSIFAELARFLERAGPGPEPAPGTGLKVGYVTALLSVLVDGDDCSEPLADAIRGMLDGHVVLDRRIAETGRYPAIDVLRSLSRSVPGCQSPTENALMRRARAVLSRYRDIADLLRLGAYERGLDTQSDEAVELGPKIEAWLAQGREAYSEPEPSDIESSFRELAELLGPERTLGDRGHA